LWSRRKNCRHPAALAIKAPASKGECAVEHRDEHPAGRTPLSQTFTETKLKDLPACNDPVLSFSKRSNRSGRPSILHRHPWTDNLRTASNSLPAGLEI
jgi:hypothetical protein